MIALDTINHKREIKKSQIYFDKLGLLAYRQNESVNNVFLCKLNIQLSLTKKRQNILPNRTHREFNKQLPSGF